MFPKEHGAYGQLLFPIATAFAIGHFRVPAVALALAAVSAFIAHEPLLILLGQRGPRAARERRGEAWRWFAGFGGAALAFAIVSLVTLPAPARLALAVTAMLGLGLAGFIGSGREHTLAGESCMSVTMGSLAAPVALAAGASVRGAVTLAVAFGAAFLAPTIAVHAVIAFTRRPPAIKRRVASVAAAIIAVAGAAAAASTGIIAPAGLWAAVPACAAAAVLAISPPSARHLRIVGWTLVATSTATAAILLVGLSGL